jgi:hypothetical protein
MRRTEKYAAVPPARRVYAPEGRGMRVTQSFDPAQDREPVERPFDASTLLSIDPERCRRVDFAQGHELVEWQMGILRQPLPLFEILHCLFGIAELKLI